MKHDESNMIISFAYVKCRKAYMILQKAYMKHEEANVNLRVSSLICRVSSVFFRVLGREFHPANWLRYVSSHLYDRLSLKRDGLSMICYKVNRVNPV